MRLSVVLISYNMARELPRTLTTLSPEFQLGVSAEDYEIILVDNGSTQEFDEKLYCRLAPNLSVVRMDDAAPSPVGAINRGLQMARGDLVGVLIDGARMASPGLLRAALAASKTFPRAVVGTLAFHLGPDVQMQSVLQGYDQKAEDALLASVDWRADGYRLFDIAVFAGSSSKGWFILPAETNALFLPAEQWRAIGGYDPAFVSAGGGLANLDTWERLCADPSNEVVMLLGEATFHQFHGGVATNSLNSPWESFHEEYRALRRRPYRAPTRRPYLFGSLSPHALASVARSCVPGVGGGGST